MSDDEFDIERETAKAVLLRNAGGDTAWCPKSVWERWDRHGDLDAIEWIDLNCEWRAPMPRRVSRAVTAADHFARLTLAGRGRAPAHD